VPSFELTNADHYGFRVDPDFTHVERVQISWIRFWTREPYELFYRAGEPLGEKESHATDQPKRKTSMHRLFRKLRATNGQDLLEYALLAGFIAVASVAVMPAVASSISTIFSKLDSVMEIASTQGN
jgi:pilus assembly protein Flp/PilA